MQGHFRTVAHFKVGVRQKVNITVDLHSTGSLHGGGECADSNLRKLRSSYFICADKVYHFGIFRGKLTADNHRSIVHRTMHRWSNYLWHQGGSTVTDSRTSATGATVESIQKCSGEEAEKVCLHTVDDDWFAGVHPHTQI